jgi:SM-20-related protein
MSVREIVLRLNPALNPEPWAEIYRREGVVQVPGLFEPEVADALARVLETAVPWRLTYPDGKGGQAAADRQQLAALGPQGVAALVRNVVAGSSDGFGYLHMGYNMVEAYLAGRDPGHPLHSLTELLNSPEFLDFGHALVGGDPITKVEAHASCYRPGDFLTLHSDILEGTRRAAFTIGLTRRWRPDWGGQLLFHDEAGEIVRGFAPAFNVLTVFRIPQAHSVATVAAYAGQQRLSIIGWLREDAVPGAAV